MSGTARHSRRTLFAAGAAVTMAGLAACSDRRAGKADDTSGAPSVPSPESVAPTEPPSAAETTTGGTTTAETMTAETTTAPAAGDYFPPTTGEWETASPAEAGLSDEGVAALVEMVGGAHSDSFVLLWQGRIVAEQYWNGADATYTRDLASAQKSVTSTLVGLARDRGLLTLDDPASDYLPAGWSAADPADEAAITIRHLLTMSSGLNPRTLRKDAAPGTVWDYNTDAYQKLRSVLEVAAGTDINTLSQDWLFDAIGITESAPWAPRGNLTDAVGDATYGLTISAREMARFGLFAMRRGAWAGEQITAADWFDEAWASVPLKRDYGYLWWLLGKGHFASKGAPPDLVAALGAQDQKIYVSPSAGLVLVRQGSAAGEVSQTESDFDAALITALVNARA